MSELYYLLWISLTLISLYQLLIEKREPSSTVAWIVVVLALPIIGPILFLIFGPQRLERQAIKRRQQIDQYVSDANYPLAEENQLEAWIPESDRDVFRLLSKVSQYPCTASNQAQILANPEEALTAMRQAIAKAKKFIHLEYYIISGDEVTRQLMSDLEVAARRGVEVRILFDSLGSLFLKNVFFRRLKQAGAKTAGFLPLIHFPKRLNFNFRNHRKALIVDGHCAFTGGANIGRQYLGLKFDNQWRDNFVMVTGPACLQLQDVFAKDWHFTTQEDLFNSHYYPRPVLSDNTAGNTVIQVLESGPDTEFFTLHQAVFLALSRAKKHVRMMTPYFVPDEALTTSIIATALRGVKVQLILPSLTDNRVVQFAARSYYEFLLRAGVSIFEYKPRILHSKMLIVDERLLLLGSANMDVRSFRLNFELNLWIYGDEVAGDAIKVFDEDLKHCERVNYDSFIHRGRFKRLVENTCRLFSPVL